MSNSIEYERITFDQVKLNDLLTGEDGEVATFLETLGVKAETEAKRRCPVDTGRLRSSIRHVTQKDEDGLAAYIGSDVNYSTYVEQGTEVQQAQPYLRPAVDAVLAAL